LAPVNRGLKTAGNPPKGWGVWTEFGTEIFPLKGAGPFWGKKGKTPEFLGFKGGKLPWGKTLKRKPGVIPFPGGNLKGGGLAPLPLRGLERLSFKARKFVGGLWKEGFWATPKRKVSPFPPGTVGFIPTEKADQGHFIGLKLSG